MPSPFKECANCVGTGFCKVFNGINPPKGNKNRCDAAGVFNDSQRLAHIPEDYRKANLSTFEVDVYNQNVYEGIKPLVDDIRSFVEHGKGVNFVGEVTGTGKTFSACVLLNQYMFSLMPTHEQSFDFFKPDALYVSYTELIARLRDNRRDMWDEIEMIQNVPLLLLDDIGAGVMSDYAREQTYIIVDYRFTHKLSTITTSNYTLSKLQNDKLLGARTVSRLIANSIGIKCHGQDRRLTV